MIDTARIRGDRTKARDALIQLGMAHRRGDNYPAAVECLTQALEECRAMGDERQTADTLYHLGTVFWSDGRNRAASVYHAEAVEICERLELNCLVAVQAYHGRGESHFMNLEPSDAVRCYQRSNEIARRIGDKSYESENLMMIGHAYSGYLGLGDYAQARVNMEAALEIAERADLQWHIPPTRLGLACVRGHLGDYAAAVKDVRDTMRALERSKLPRYQLMAYEMLAALLLEVSLHDQAFEASERGRALGDSAGINFWRVRREATHSIARMRLGDLGVGAALNATLSWARDNDERSQMVTCLEGLAELALRRGEIQACREFAEEMLTLADGAGMKELAARGHRWRGEARAALGERDAAVEDLTLAASAADKLGRVRIAKDATDALAKISRDSAHLTRAAALAARIEQNARECERLLAS